MSRTIEQLEQRFGRDTINILAMTSASFVAGEVRARSALVIDVLQRHRMEMLTSCNALLFVTSGSLALNPFCIVGLASLHELRLTSHFLPVGDESSLCRALQATSTISHLTCSWATLR